MKSVAAVLPALALALPFAAAEPPAASPPAAKAARVADPNRLPNGSPDPIEHLRRRLAEKLGAAPAPDADPRVVRVGTPAGAATPVVARESAPAPKRAPAAARAPVDWAYDGPGGPARWGALKPEWATCAKGTRQSPIELRDPIRLDLEPIAFDYRPGAFRVRDTGHTIQVDVDAGNTIEVRGRRFALEQFHFHRPSEEVIDGHRFDMSLHLVHRDAAGRLAVVAVLLDAGAPQPTLQQVWNHLPLERSEVVTARQSLDPAALLPAGRGYYATMGSLTTPPCDEGVLWLVMQQPVAVSPEQIAVFARLHPMNARPLQPAHDRLVQASP